MSNYFRAINEDFGDNTECRTKQYIVKVRGTYMQPFKISAMSPEEAKQRVVNGEGEIIKGRLSYGYLLNPDTWAIERKED